MKKTTLIALFSFLTVYGISQTNDTLYLHYVNQAPFAYTENGSLKGIEIEIINEYVFWLKSKKKVNINIKHIPVGSTSDLLAASKRSGKNQMGLGAVGITPEKFVEVDLTGAYMKKVAFCVTNGHAPDVKVENKEDIIRALGSMEALTINNTPCNRALMDLKKKYIPDLRIAYHSEEKKILDEVARNVLMFGYVDAVSFYSYLKNNPSKFIKIQKVLNRAKEEAGFVVPKGSPHKLLFAEFFSGPNGFKNGQNYRFILEKYLGTYMTQILAIN